MTSIEQPVVPRQTLYKRLGPGGNGMSGTRNPVMTRDGIVLRRCSTCHAWKPKTLEHFGILYLNFRGDAVLEGYCRPCRNAYNATWRREHRERRNAYMRQWQRGIPRAEMELPE